MSSLSWGKYSLVVATAVGFSWPMTRKAAFPDYTRKADASDKTVILTGATGTLGTAAALNLARRKCRLIMACRNMEKCKSLRREIVLLTSNANISCRRLNLEDVDSIVEFADDIIKNEPHVDTLVNCASVRDLPTRELTKYGVERHFFVNFLAPYLLTFKLLGKLKESAKTSKDSRVVNITDGPKLSWKIEPNDINFDKRTYTAREAYRQSKLAIAHFTIVFNKIFESENVRAFGVAPPESIYKILEHRLTLSEQLRVALKCWTSISANSGSGTTVLCAIDDFILKDDGGGGLYKYIFRSFGRNKGWGPIGSRELDGQFIWNLGANMLINLPKTPGSSNINFTDFATGPSDLTTESASTR